MGCGELIKYKEEHKETSEPTYLTTTTFAACYLDTLNKLQNSKLSPRLAAQFLQLYKMSSSAAKMNAVPESGPVKTVQLQDKIIAITGANRGLSSP